jgi:hypothetical protein
LLEIQQVGLLQIDFAFRAQRQIAKIIANGNSRTVQLLDVDVSVPRV